VGVEELVSVHLNLETFDKGCYLGQEGTYLLNLEIHNSKVKRERPTALQEERNERWGHLAE
jgi:hypothetical protein